MTEDRVVATKTWQFEDSGRVAGIIFDWADPSSEVPTVWNMSTSRRDHRSEQSHRCQGHFGSSLSNRETPTQQTVLGTAVAGSPRPGPGGHRTSGGSRPRSIRSASWHWRSVIRPGRGAVSRPAAARDPADHPAALLHPGRVSDVVIAGTIDFTFIRAAAAWPVWGRMIPSARDPAADGLEPPGSRGHDRSGPIVSRRVRHADRAWNVSRSSCSAPARPADAMMDVFPVPAC